jgi:GTP diphosphokinase / guanosine-3',5'-bis(diphosphate) 3'-diphosphatase
MKGDPTITSDKQLQHQFDSLIGLLEQHKGSVDSNPLRKAFELLQNCPAIEKNPNGDSIVQATVETAAIAVEEMGLGGSSVKSIFLRIPVQENTITLDDIGRQFGASVRTITEGLLKISDIGQTTTVSQAENYRKLLLNLARDVRVILIRLAEQLQIMRNMKSLPVETQLRISSEASFLYAPLAHRLGLYIIKSEMEDLALKYTDRRTYNSIARKLDETMRARKKFIDSFIQPIENELKKHNFDFEIKGRPKSIHSIWNKMIKKNVEFEDIYDLFAIRIILNCDLPREKSDCWQVYSVVTDIYQPNPLRLRDWISVPKTNGYESLHTTVIGPDGKWVEVQIRTRRMNEIAEKGFAAHWKYKGLETEQGLDEWLLKIRDVLEAPETDAVDFIDDFKLSLYSKEIFVFTPKGDLKKFPQGATVLDYAYDVHSDVGDTCTGAKINGKVVPIRFPLNNGDKVEIITSKNQTPKLDWLNVVITSKAKAKIRHKLNEEKVREAENGKEILKRRFKNWKINFTDDVIRKLMKKYRQKNAQDLYYLVSLEKIDLTEIKELLSIPEATETAASRPAEEELPTQTETKSRPSKHDDYLIIDEQIANVDYKLAKCCNPIFGDDIFGFVTVSEGIKIHRTNCPNAAQLISKYNYRIVKTKWKKTSVESSFPAEIKITAEDVTGILNDISEVISKDPKIHLRGINLNTDKGMIEGRIKLMVKDLQHLDSLMARLSGIKGIFKVTRFEQYS